MFLQAERLAIAEERAQDHYEVLGIPYGASIDAICRAFRLRAQMTHPDMGGTKEANRAVLVALHALIEGGCCQRSFLKLPPLAATASRRATALCRLSVRRHQKATSALGRLVATLRESAREQRRAALQQLSPRLRAELLAFMSEGSSKSSSVSIRSKSCMTSGTSVSRWLEDNSDCSTAVAAAAAAHAATSTALGPCGGGSCTIERISRGSDVHYRVTKCSPHLDLVIKTQYVPSLELAVEMCLVLVQAWFGLSSIDARLGGLGANTCDSGVFGVARTIKEAVPLRRLMQDGSKPGGEPAVELAHQPRERGLTSASLGAAISEASVRASSFVAASDMKLSFRARVWCECVGGRVEGSCTEELGEALAHRELLLAAGREDWQALRSQLIRIRQLPTRRRSRRLDAAEAALRVDAAYSPSSQSELQRAARAAERVLKAREPRAKATKPRTTLGAVKRGRWRSDQHLNFTETYARPSLIGGSEITAAGAVQGDCSFCESMMPKPCKQRRSQPLQARQLSHAHSCNSSTPNLPTSQNPTLAQATSSAANSSGASAWECSGYFGFSTASH